MFYWKNTSWRLNNNCIQVTSDLLKCSVAATKHSHQTLAATKQDLCHRLLQQWIRWSWLLKDLWEGNAIMHLIIINNKNSTWISLLVVFPEQLQSCQREKWMSEWIDLLIQCNVCRWKIFLSLFISLISFFGGQNEVTHQHVKIYNRLSTGTGVHQNKGLQITFYVKM